MHFFQLGAFFLGDSSFDPSKFLFFVFKALQDTCFRHGKGGGEAVRQRLNVLDGVGGRVDAVDFNIDGERFSLRIQDIAAFGGNDDPPFIFILHQPV
jgi:hypothetical protein